MSLASRRWGLADGQGEILPDGLRFVKSDWQRVTDPLPIARSAISHQQEQEAET